MLAQAKAGTLEKIPLFRGLSGQDLSRLAPMLHHMTMYAGSNLMSVAEQGEAVYILLGGTVKIHVEQRDGSDVILAILGAGETVGDMDMVDALGRSANVVTLEETELLWMQRAAFQECLQTMPTLTLNLTRILTRRLRISNAQVQALSALDVYGRVARQILAFAQEYGHSSPNGDIIIPFRLTQTDMADLVGASRVRVNQVLVHFKEQHYISVDQNYRITLHDRGALAQRCL
jgi:CRP/FNR family transcriptional regulator, cyclic AMP receptor protein